ncbi:hypothetical protein [Luteimonas sp. MC1828]|uniref:hypothetical protein n=1 Tax=Luteimonas sp. MC1828 TaxID=2799787 RepID=UPI0018F12CB3|nr:hypothetical protein [Luteimonas sp. MC1828]MBJ7576262.1 hypothetical protein [Luteimonas sp. MC1828]
MKEHRSSRFSQIAFALGALALLVCIVEFWVSAAAPSPAIEDVVADKVVAIRDATIDRLAGRTTEAVPAEQPWKHQQLFVAFTSFLGGLAIVLAGVGYSRKEPRRTCAVAASLGLAAVVFPYVIGAIGAVVVIIAVGAVLSMFLG